MSVRRDLMRRLTSRNIFSQADIWHKNRKWKVEGNVLIWIIIKWIITVQLFIAMTEKFEFVSKLGEGSFASVFKVRRQEDSNFYAFKKIKVDKIGTKELNNSLNEIRILASVKCPYVVAYKEAFYDEKLKSFCLVTEYAEGGDLCGRITRMKKSKQSMGEKEVWKIAIQLLFGIKSLHAMNIFHRDIKPANILLTKDDMEAKLADMNVSIISKTGFARTQTGTPYYASPEVWLERTYDGKSDIWSLGCVLYELTAHNPPFMAQEIPGLRKKIIEADYCRIPSEYSNELECLIRCCLTKDQSKRPSVKDLLNLQIVKDKMKMFPDQKFNSSIFLPNLDHRTSMLATIKLPARNFSAVQLKLPKCNYDDGKENKENVGAKANHILQNHSCGVKEDKNVPTNMKLPDIKRAESASNKRREEKPMARKEVLRREYIKKIRS